ncbi:MAG: hypothetical protein VXY94_06550 [Planctomycetota bacterium]|nr:hypothetical protein [Planctomycetota bacterium]
MASNLPTSLSAAILIAICAGCTNSKKQVAGTDIPVIPQLQHTGTQVVSGSRRAITDGSASFQGPVYDALERARWSEANFEHLGWTFEKISGTPRQATAVFVKPVKDSDVQRVATLDVTADRRDGVATIHFSTRTPGSGAAPASGDPEGASAPAPGASSPTKPETPADG